MSSISALTWIETLVGLALFQQSIEMTWINRSTPLRWFFLFRAVLSLTLLFLGLHHLAVPGGLRLFHLAGLLDLVLLVSGILLLRFWRGPYNGGSDRMALLLLSVCTLGRLSFSDRFSELILSYLAVQLIFSYFIAGVVKLRAPRWRSGTFLAWVFQRSTYPVSQADRLWSKHGTLLRVLTFAALTFEILFPLSLLRPWTLAIALGMALTFHWGNAWFLGLNRFLWIWPASYPALIWFQQRWI